MLRRIVSGLIAAILLVGCGEPTFDLSGTDLTSILRAEDLPPGMTSEVGPVGDAEMRINPPPGKIAARAISTADGTIGIVTLLLYNNSAAAEQAYDGLKLRDALPGTGDTGSVLIGPQPAYQYVFRRCRAVVSATFVPLVVELPDQALVAAFMGRIDGRIRETPLCGA